MERHLKLDCQEPQGRRMKQEALHRTRKEKAALLNVANVVSQWHQKHSYSSLVNPQLLPERCGGLVQVTIVAGKSSS
jgi:hypothetical protein